MLDLVVLILAGLIFQITSGVIHYITKNRRIYFDFAKQILSGYDTLFPLLNGRLFFFQFVG